MLPAGATDVFVYTIKDGDGDTSTTTLTINLTDSGITAPNDSDVTVNESALDTNALPDGSDLAVGTVTGSLPGSPLETDASNQLNGSGGTAPLTYALVSGGNAATAGAFGTIQVNADGSYVYTLTKPFDTSPDADNSANTEVAENFQYRVTDANGNSATGTITVNIVDDVPTAEADGPITPAEDTTITFNVTANDVFGADGVDLATGVAKTTNPTKGTVSYNSDGTFTYTPTAGQTGSDSFTYTITDRDGDSSTATVSITLAADSVPSVVSTTNLTVDEDGFLATRNLDQVPPAANETDSTESLIDASGIAKVTFGKDVPANLLRSIQLVDTAALDGQLHTDDGQSVTFALDGIGDLVGTVNAGATEVIRIHITGASLTNAATGEVSYTYSTTLSQPIKHASLDGLPGDNSENSALLSGVTFAVTDKDTDTTQGTFNVTIVDDVPRPIAPKLLVASNVAGTVATAALDADGNIDNNVGADQPGTV